MARTGIPAKRNEGGVMNRDVRQQPVFQDDADRQRFMATLGKACAKTGRQVKALCLMPNHFHLVGDRRKVKLAARLPAESTVTVT